MTGRQIGYKSNAWEKAFEFIAGALHKMAQKLNPVWPGGMDYVKINVLGFCILVPVVLVGSLGLNVAFLLGLL